ncbi:MAG: VWA domain-containing protein [Pyrinomonadaceae bacterium]
MKKIITAILFPVFCLAVSNAFAQSSNRQQTNDIKKANQRPAETKTPKPEKIEEVISEDPTIDDDGDVIEIATEIVMLPVRVIDRKGRFVAGLQKENFKVFENKTEQEIAFFNNEQQPFTVALVLDMSYSTTFKINEIQSAAIDFINQLRPSDKVMVVSFDEEIHILSEPTADRQRLQRAVMQTKVASGTSLYEAVDLVVNKRLKATQGRKAIVLFTDGVDTTSRRAHDLSNIRDLEETDVLVYPVHYDTFADVQRIKNQSVIIPPPQTIPVPTSTPKSPFPFPIPTGGIGTPSSQGTSAEDYRRAAEYLNEMANRTGGRIYEADSLTNLDRAFASIASELREFYSIGYYLPEGAKPGEKRRLKIKVDRENVAVKARDSYTVGKKIKAKK